MADSYTFTGDSARGYQSYVDTGTDRMLVAKPGVAYAMRPVVAGDPVPPNDGRWQASEAGDSDGQKQESGDEQGGHDDGGDAQDEGAQSAGDPAPATGTSRKATKTTAATKAPGAKAGA